MELDDITGAVIGEALHIHRALGPELLESVYEMVLAAALKRRDLRVERQRPCTFTFDGIMFESAFRVDLFVEECVIVECKSVERLHPVHAKQLLTYLRLTDHRVGLLLNFGAPTLKQGIKRVVNDLSPSASPRLRVNITHSRKVDARIADRV